jgi:hypothetical protein
VLVTVLVIVLVRTHAIVFETTHAIVMTWISFNLPEFPKMKYDSLVVEGLSFEP